MLRILCLALIIAFVGSITPSLAQGTTGSSGHALKHKTATVHSPTIMMKSKKNHHPKVGKKGKKGSGNTGGHPPK
jgi:hypothetical protein